MKRYEINLVKKEDETKTPTSYEINLVNPTPEQRVMKAAADMALNDSRRSRAERERANKGTAV